MQECDGSNKQQEGSELRKEGEQVASLHVVSGWRLTASYDLSSGGISGQKNKVDIQISSEKVSEMQGMGKFFVINRTARRLIAATLLLSALNHVLGLSVHLEPSEQHALGVGNLERCVDGLRSALARCGMEEPASSY